MGFVKADRCQELADKICEKLIEGKSLRSVCREEGMPDISYVMRWLSEDENFEKQYVRAREAQAETHFEEFLEVTEDVRKGRLDPASARVVIDAMKWATAKMKPKRYGDKMAITDPDGGPVAFVIRDMSKED